MAGKEIEIALEAASGCWPSTMLIRKPVARPLALYDLETNELRGYAVGIFDADPMVGETWAQYHGPADKMGRFDRTPVMAEYPADLTAWVEFVVEMGYTPDHKETNE